MVEWPRLPRRTTPDEFLHKIVPGLLEVFVPHFSLPESLTLILKIDDDYGVVLEKSGSLKVSVLNVLASFSLKMDVAAFNALYDFFVQQYNSRRRKDQLSAWRDYLAVEVPRLVSKVPALLSLVQNNPGRVEAAMTDELGASYNIIGVVGEPSAKCAPLNISFSLARLATIANPAATRLSSLGHSYIQASGNTDYLAKIITILG